MPPKSDCGAIVALNWPLLVSDRCGDVAGVDVPGPVVLVVVLGQPHPVLLVREHVLETVLAHVLTQHRGLEQATAAATAHQRIIHWKIEIFQDHEWSRLHITLHIFPKAQVASNKNAHKLRHHFWAKFFMLFHMVRPILFRVLALKTFRLEVSDWLLQNFKLVSQPNTSKKRITKMVSEVVCIFVWGHLWLLKDVSLPSMRNAKPSQERFYKSNVTCELQVCYPSLPASNLFWFILVHSKGNLSWSFNLKLKKVAWYNGGSYWWANFHGRVKT